MENRAEVTELRPGIFQIRGLNGSSHSYVIKGNYKNVMIDSGSDQNFPVLERGLFRIGRKVRDIDLVINSHEHCDHIGANRYFHESAMIAAYRLAASKMISGDYYVTMYKGNDLNEIPIRVHLWLENMTRIDLGNYSLRIFHTPGHTSGCISIVETTQGLLFSADSVFAGGTLSYIAESGSIGDYIDSDETALFWLAGALPRSRSHFNDAHRGHRCCYRQCSKAFGKFDGQRPRDFLSKSRGELIDRPLSVHD
jgi:hydroxyacylglutathione hydrolase